MESLLHGLTGVIMYIDDILVDGSTEEEHLSRLCDVLALLDKNGLCAQISKCHFLISLMSFLGHRVAGDGLYILSLTSLKRYWKSQHLRISEISSPTWDYWFIIVNSFQIWLQSWPLGTGYTEKMSAGTSQLRRMNPFSVSNSYSLPHLFWSILIEIYHSCWHVMLWLWELVLCSFTYTPWRVRTPHRLCLQVIVASQTELLPVGEGRIVMNFLVSMYFIHIFLAPTSYSSPTTSLYAPSSLSVAWHHLRCQLALAGGQSVCQLMWIHSSWEILFLIAMMMHWAGLHLRLHQQLATLHQK